VGRVAGARKRCLRLGAIRRAYERLERFVTGTEVVAPDDCVVALWLANSLLAANWAPSDDQLAVVEHALRISQPSVMASIARGDIYSATDAAFAFEGIADGAGGSLARRSLLDNVLSVVDAFPASAAILRNRQRGRQAFEIGDEYDVQDLFRALILPTVPDLVPEDPASKVAGKSSRLDFVSKSARLGFELKHLKSLSDRERVRTDVILDEHVYHAHPYIDTVVVLVSDPGSAWPLAERLVFERDLSQTIAIGGRTIRYIVRIR
jgi:hypothetical protein